MFDWGAKAVADILTEDLTFGLKNALAKINDRSWIFNGLPDFIKRIQVGHKRPLITGGRWRMDLI